MHFNELRTSHRVIPAQRKLVLRCTKADRSPSAASGAMKFVNQDEDQASPRLAAERYTQYKLAQLDQKR